MDKDEAFLKRLLSTFKVEAAEHLAAISSGFLELEKNPDSGRRAELIEIVFREAHSLKGAARTVNASAIETVWRSMEDIFSALKKKDRGLAPDLFGLLHEALDLTGDLLGSLDTEGGGPDKSRIKGLVLNLDRTAKDLGETPPIAGPEPVRAPYRPEVPAAAGPRTSGPLGAATIRVEKAKLDDLLLQAEGLLQAKQFAAERSSELREVVAAIEAAEKRWTAARNDTRAVGRFLKQGLRPAETAGMGASMTRLLEFMESCRDAARELHRRLGALARRMENDRRTVAGMVDTLLEGTKRISMTPFSTLFDVLPAMARNLLTEQGKEAGLTVSGGDVEVDRRILEEMKDPLMHLIRNCVDHGIERPGERALRGKPPSGRISVSASQRDSGKVEVVVADDGSGIETARVKTSAIKLGILSAENAEKLDEERLRALVFRSGVSTSPLITDISGRGLGLAIVQEKAERLGGLVSCESSAEGGTLFRILLPVTLATVRGLLVRIGEQLFVIPAAYVSRTFRASFDEIKPVEGRETLSVDGTPVPLIQLAGVLEQPVSEQGRETPAFLYAVALESEDKVIAFTVDEVLYEQEFIVKGLGRQLRRVRNVIGAAVLGAGRVVAVLNVPDLMKSAVRSADTVPSAAPPSRQDGGAKIAPRGRRLRHRKDPSQEYPRGRGVRCQDRGRRHRRICASESGTFRSRAVRCGHAQNERFRAYGENKVRQVAGRPPGRPRHRARFARRQGARHRCRRERLHCEEQLRPEQPSGSDKEADLMSGGFVIKVLVVDDSPTAREYLVHIFESDPAIDGHRDGAGRCRSGGACE